MESQEMKEKILEKIQELKKRYGYTGPFYYPSKLEILTELEQYLYTL